MHRIKRMEYPAKNTLIWMQQMNYGTLCIFIQFGSIKNVQTWNAVSHKQTSKRNTQQQIWNLERISKYTNFNRIYQFWNNICLCIFTTFIGITNCFLSIQNKDNNLLLVLWMFSGLYSRVVNSVVNNVYIV